MTTTPDGDRAPRPVHLLFWDGEVWSCNCGIDGLGDSDGRAYNHYSNVYGTLGTREAPR